MIFKNWRFYIAFLVTILIFCAIAPFFSVWFAILIIPYAILGLIIWSILKTENKAVAWGILLGSLMPLLWLIGGLIIFSFKKL